LHDSFEFDPPGLRDRSLSPDHRLIAHSDLSGT
jgi:hypothetical protein